MGKKTSNLLFHGEEPDGAAADVLKSYNVRFQPQLFAFLLSVWAFPLISGVLTVLKVGRPLAEVWVCRGHDQEVVYQGPPADLVSALAKETREIKAGWQIQNGPETFLVHRHPGAPGGPKDVPIPGVGYPGKWGAQVDDEYRFKKRRGDQKYFQNANDPDAKGERLGFHGARRLSTVPCLVWFDHLLTRPWFQALLRCWASTGT